MKSEGTTCGVKTDEEEANGVDSMPGEGESLACSSPCPSPSQTKTDQLQDEEVANEKENKSGAISRVITKYPKSVMCTAFWITFILGMIAIIFFPLKISATGNFYIREDPIAEKYDAFYQLVQDTLQSSLHQIQQTQPEYRLTVIYIAKGGDNVFTPSRIRKMESVRKDMEGVDDLNSFCWKTNGICETPYSPEINLFKGGYSSQSLINAQLLQFANEFNGTEMFFDPGFSASHLESDITRTEFRFGLPLKGYASKYDDKEEQEDELEEWEIDEYLKLLDPEKISNDEMEIIHWGDPLSDFEINTLVANDMRGYWPILCRTFLYLYLAK